MDMNEIKDLVRAVLSWGVGGCSDCEPAYNRHVSEIYHEAYCGYWKDVKKLCAATGFDGYTETTAEEMDGKIGYKRLRFSDESEPVALKDKIFCLEDKVAHLEYYLFELHKVAKETVDQFVDDYEMEPKLRPLRQQIDSLSRVMNRVSEIKGWPTCAKHNPNNENCPCPGCSNNAKCVECGKSPCYFTSVNNPFCSGDCMTVNSHKLTLKSLMGE